jgi:predicted amidophosphoribosyltransferase
MIGGVLDVLFPPRCAGCGGGRWPFCPACWSVIALLDPPGCLRCGRPLDVVVPRCADCPPSAVSWSRAPFLYDGPVRRALMALKFGGLQSRAEALGPWMARSLARSPPANLSESEPVVLTWVPLGRRRQRSRGYDQALALAGEVARLTGWPLQRLLARVAETAPQARRSGPQRRLAMGGAFHPVGHPPGRVILIDDVLTSGATAAECARVLRQAGAGEVGLLCAARSLGGAVPARCYNPAMSRPGSVVARERSFR